jgi:phosphocarrier protein
VIERSFPILCKLGLHARPAAMLVKTVQPFLSQIRLRRDDQEVDAKSIMGILTLTAEYGSRLVVTADGPDEDDVISTLADFFERRLPEEE